MNCQETQRWLGAYGDGELDQCRDDQRHRSDHLHRAVRRDPRQDLFDPAGDGVLVHQQHDHVADVVVGRAVLHHVPMVELMLGLPGQTTTTFAEQALSIVNSGATPANAAP